MITTDMLNSIEYVNWNFLLILESEFLELVDIRSMNSVSMIEIEDLYFI